MRTKDIDAMREIRLWITSIIVPLGVAVIANPQIMDDLKARHCKRKGKPYIHVVK